MPERSRLLPDPGYLTGLPDVHALLEGRGWTRRAACLNREDLFDGEDRTSRGPAPSSPIGLARMLTCARCPIDVRRACLRDALAPRTTGARIADDGRLLPGDQLETFGTWGGSFDVDRRRLRHLPPDEAADELMGTFGARLEARVEAWKATIASRTARTRYDAEVAEALGVDLPPLPDPCATCGGPRYSGRKHRECERERQRQARAAVGAC